MPVIGNGSNPQQEPNVPVPPGYNIYIGSRYVPIFYKNPDGTAEYNPNVGYEYLTIVTYQGNSYTSRMNVPVGIPPTNITYWIPTGNYNAQVQEYLNKVNQFNGRITANEADIAKLQTDLTTETTTRQNADSALDSRITTVNANLEHDIDSVMTEVTNETKARTEKDTYLENRIGLLADHRFILIGDSYGANVGGWIDQFKAMMGTVNIYSNAIGGASFTAQNSFLSLLRNLTVPTPGTITDIIVCGGINDVGHSPEQITTAIDEFVNYCNTTFPNAKVYLGYISNTHKVEQLGVQYFRTVIAYKQARNVIYLNNVEYILKLNRYLSGDGLHPTADGYTALAKGIIQAWKGGLNVTYWQQNIPFTNKQNQQQSTTCMAFMNNNNCQVIANIGNTYLINQTGLGSEVNIELGSFAFEFIYCAGGDYSPWFNTTSFAVTNSEGITRFVNLDIKIQQGKIYGRSHNLGGNEMMNMMGLLYASFDSLLC